MRSYLFYKKPNYKFETDAITINGQKYPLDSLKKIYIQSTEPSFIYLPLAWVLIVIMDSFGGMIRFWHMSAFTMLLLFMASLILIYIFQGNTLYCAFDNLGEMKNVEVGTSKTKSELSNWKKDLIKQLEERGFRYERINNDELKIIQSTPLKKDQQNADL